MLHDRNGQFYARIQGIALVFQSMDFVRGSSMP